MTRQKKCFFCVFLFVNRCSFLSSAFECFLLKLENTIWTDIYLAIHWTLWTFQNASKLGVVITSARQAHRRHVFSRNIFSFFTFLFSLSGRALPPRPWHLRQPPRAPAIHVTCPVGWEIIITLAIYVNGWTIIVIFPRRPPQTRSERRPGARCPSRARRRPWGCCQCWGTGSPSTARWGLIMCKLIKDYQRFHPALSSVRQLWIEY